MAEHRAIAFGELLSTFRTHCGLSQRRLAEYLGVHRNTIGSWERGEYLPQSKALVLELARRLHLEEHEKRQLLEASLTALSPSFVVPLLRNPFFTGREQILQTLHTQLATDERAGGLSHACALSGLGGMGKTQVALEYAYRYALCYSAVFWLTAETVESLVSSFVRIAERLGLSGRDDQEQQMVAAVQHWLFIHKGWLLICDNVEELDLLHRFLPASREGAILLTTRAQTVGTLAVGIELLPMVQQEGMRLLLCRAKVLPAEASLEQVQQFGQRLPAEYAAAEELIREMGGLPLALDQAAAYIEETGCSFLSYLQCYQHHRSQLLGRRGALGSDHPASIMMTLQLSCQQVAARHPAALDLLRFCAFLAPDSIPQELLEQGACHLGPVLGPVAADPLQLDQVIATLRHFSLLQRHPPTGTLSLHRLVQTVLRDEMSEQERAQWIRRVMAALNAAFPGVKSERWRQGEQLVPHVLACANAIPDSTDDQNLAEVLRKAADALRERAQYLLAQPLYERALHMYEAIVGSQHPAVALVLTNLAWLCYEQGNYQQAERFVTQALRMYEETLGPQHLDVTSALNGLAVLSEAQGKYEQAERLYERALRIREEVLGPEHPEVALLLNNMASLCQKRGNYEQAERLYERALRILEEAWGPHHPRVALPLCNLADLYSEKSNYEQAKHLYQRSLSIWEEAWGPFHPRVALSLTGLAHLYVKEGEEERAEALFKQALSIREQVQGSEHPEVARVLNGLANLRLLQGNYEQAEALYQRTLHIREERLGPQHPEMGQTLHELALLRQKQCTLSEAIALAQRALAIRAQVLGERHPKTVATRTLCAQMLQSRVCAGEEGAIASQSPAAASPAADDPLHEFLVACCERHPRACCPSRDLWQAYQRWAKERQERFPLSRRAFTRHLQLQGIRAARTKRARLWQGITLRSTRS
ncbi:MAG: DUF2225 domain-containing protein [Chloroflexi bacterium]|nr:DUF2225 domain-containing protein [Chloroflexota bacterium]